MSKPLILEDHNGTVLRAERVGPYLQLQLQSPKGNWTAFYAISTHVGKILELVVDQFFPKPTSEDG